MKKLLAALFMGVFAATHVPAFAAEKAQEKATEKTKTEEKAKEEEKKKETKKKKGGCG
jgi:ribosomal protein L12E/L44/L45/RPP1/RPP2